VPASEATVRLAAFGGRAGASALRVGKLVVRFSHVIFFISCFILPAMKSVSASSFAKLGKSTTQTLELLVRRLKNIL
jgi:hypothetical protein